MKPRAAIAWKPCTSWPLPPGSGELQGFKWDDLDLEAGTLQVRRTLSEPKGGYIFEAPKSGKGRSVWLTHRATAALREHRRRQL